jgi:hypothetical protein
MSNNTGSSVESVTVVAICVAANNIRMTCYSAAPAASSSRPTRWSRCR